MADEPPNQESGDAVIRLSGSGLHKGGTGTNLELAEITRNPGGFVESHRICLRKCTHYIEGTTDGVCKCGYSKDAHDHEAKVNRLPSEVEWNVGEHSEAKQLTNAYGEVYFEDSRRTAKFMRIDSETDSNTVVNLLFNHWKLRAPSLIIMVAGGAQNFRLGVKISRNFRQSFIRAAQTIGAWIITGGTYTGVMKHTGKAVRDYAVRQESFSDVVCLGIVPWGVVRDRHELLKKGEVDPCISASQQSLEYLDIYHTHFLLVDNGTHGQYSAETPFRSRLEDTLATGDTGGTSNWRSKIPICLLMVEGGPGTLKEVHNALQRKMPVIVVQGSGRMADILSFGYTSLQPFSDQDRAHGLKQTNLSTKLRALLRELDPEPCKEQVEQWLGQIEDCLVNYFKLMLLFRLDAQDAVKSLDTAIFTSLINAEPKGTLHFQLCFAWNRLDLAEKYLFTDDNCQFYWTPSLLHELTDQAIKLDLPDFVRAFLRQGVTLKAYLTTARLVSLYRATPPHNLLHRVFTRLAVSVSTGRHLNPVKKYCDINQVDCLAPIGEVLRAFFGDKRQHVYCTRKLYALPQHLVPTDEVDGHPPMPKAATFVYKLPDGWKKKGEFEDPAFHLFIYAVLLKRVDLAMTFFAHLSDPIGATLMATFLLRKMSEWTFNSEEKQKYRKAADTFESHACRILSDCFDSDTYEAQQLLVRRMELMSDRTCIEIAERASAILFLSQECVQTLLSRIWFGMISDMSHRSLRIVLACFFPPAVIALQYQCHQQLKWRDWRQLKTPNCDGNDQPEKRPSGYWLQRCPCVVKAAYFYHSPAVLYAHSIITHVVFLVLLAYDLLFRYGLREHGLDDKARNPLWSAVYMNAYMLAYAVEEAIQAITSHKGTKLLSIITYFVSVWNWLELCGIILYFVAVSIDYVAMDHQVRVIGRTAYAVSAIAFSLKILHWYIPDSTLGPKVYMVGRMMTELLVFTVIMIVFIASFGLAEHALLFPGASPSWAVLRNFFFLSFWQIFEHYYFDVITPQPYELISRAHSCNTSSNSTFDYDHCADTSSIWMVSVLLVIYALVMNLLLINLLIAVFNDVISSKEVTNAHWGFERYKMILEFRSKWSPLVPPFSFLYYTVKMLVHVATKLKINQAGKSKLRVAMRVRFSPADDQKLRARMRGVRDQYVLKMEEERAESRGRRQQLRPINN